MHASRAFFFLPTNLCMIAKYCVLCFQFYAFWFALVTLETSFDLLLSCVFVWFMDLFKGKGKEKKMQRKSYSSFELVSHFFSPST